MATALTQFGLVCSAHAEVIPDRIEPRVPAASLLRTRGGDPRSRRSKPQWSRSAPHTRR